MDDNLLPKNRNNYLAAISKIENENSFGLTFVDISTGECQVFYFDGQGQPIRSLIKFTV